MYEFKLPDLGEGIHEGEVLKWHVQPGDEIKEDEDLIDVETDKAAVTIPSPASGKVVSVNGEVGELVHTGDVIVVIDDGKGQEAGSGKQEAGSGKQEAEEQGEADGGQLPAESGRRNADGEIRVAAAPAVRRRAREQGIDINAIEGSGPGGRVVDADLERTAAGVEREARGAELPEPTVDFSGPTAIPFFEVEELPDFRDWGPVEVEPLRSIRRKIARKLTSSMIIAPHVAHMDEVDVSGLAAFLKREKERDAESPLTFMAFVIKAVAGALQRFPELNASLDPHRQAIVYKKYYNVGFATDTERGLLVPVVKGVDGLGAVAISRKVRELAGQARDGSIEADSMRGGTFSITNIGMLGGTGLIPTINYPEVGILGMGQVRQKPVVRHGEIVARPMMPLTLAFDHRVTDGANAARFVNEVMARLEDPIRMLL